MTDLPTSFEPLKKQLLAASEAFSSDAQPLHDILAGLVGDVERAVKEPLEIFPVCHHSPSSAIQMVRRLQTRAPRVVFMECCEDLQIDLNDLRDCKLPVALQAFAPLAEAFPASWAPLNLVSPLTEFSAEFQAIAFCLENPETELVFVDRSCDHVFQWMPQQDNSLEKILPSELTPDELESDAGMHGAAVGVEIGSLVPTFGEFTEVLIRNARVQYFSEWWDQYVEEAIIGGDAAAYRQVMFLIGSLFRRLGTREEDRKSDELRERFMWTRIKEYLKKSKIDPSDAIYVCGAAHAASHVEEFGVENDKLWEIPPRTETQWLYGLLPSSYSAIEHQFGHPHGTVTLAQNRWKKALKNEKLKPFRLEPRGKKSKAKATKKKTTKANPKPVVPVTPPSSEHPLMTWLNKPPETVEEDEAELLQNCVRLVDLARRNGYMASSADSIAVYQTSILLANLRSRHHPTAYDFRDAAITCIEKDSIPKKRDVSRLCDILLGGDKMGQVGYESMPPLAKDIYDRLDILPIKIQARTIQRALLDFQKNPEYRPCSDLLWKLRYLLGDVVRPIMGQMQLGHVPQQESWDIAIGKHQGAVLQLGYEGITIEHVVERRLKKAAFSSDTRTINALTAAEDCLIFLKSDRLTQELGDRAIALLVGEPDVKDAREIYLKITRLIHYYRSTENGIPDWCERFVTTGYSHYATLLPDAFSNRGIAPADLAGMLQFIFTLESLALSLGCSRSQLVIAIGQSHPDSTDFSKQALLWSAQCVLQLRDLKTLRSHFDKMLDNELTIGVIPEYLSGFLLALSFTPQVSSLTMELMSKSFARLPDRILMPWLPRLVMMLRPYASTSLPGLVKEAAAAFPSNLDDLETWNPPWKASSDEPTTAPTPQESQPEQSNAVGCPVVGSFLFEFPSTTQALAQSLGLDQEWVKNVEQGPFPSVSTSAPTQVAQSTAPTSSDNAAVSQFLKSFPDSMNELAKLIE